MHRERERVRVYKRDISRIFKKLGSQTAGNTTTNNHDSFPPLLHRPLFFFFFPCCSSSIRNSEQAPGSSTESSRPLLLLGTALEIEMPLPGFDSGESRYDGLLRPIGRVGCLSRFPPLLRRRRGLEREREHLMILLDACSRQRGKRCTKHQAGKFLILIGLWNLSPGSSC